MRLTPHGKLCVALIAVGVLTIFALGWMFGAGYAMEHRDEIFNLNSLTSPKAAPQSVPADTAGAAPIYQGATY